MNFQNTSNNSFLMTSRLKNPKFVNILRLQVDVLAVIKSTRHDLTLPACLESKLKRTEHMRKVHEYELEEALRS